MLKLASAGESLLAALWLGSSPGIWLYTLTASYSHTGDIITDGLRPQAVPRGSSNPSLAPLLPLSADVSLSSCGS